MPSTKKPEKNTATQSTITADSSLDNASQPFVGRWNQLVSTTNWEKGRIILQWREALIAEGVNAAEYSDEAWTLLVGGVTGQHVGRLRRVYQRFGGVFESYDGLYWSHFCAALDWDDAEMWLEGAVQNDWSVSQMRRKRWETLDESVPEPADTEIVVAETDEDFEPALNEEPIPSTISATIAEVEGGPSGSRADRSSGGRKTSDEETDEKDGASIYADDEKEAIEFVRPFANLKSLPDDMSEAFEAFKLAILRHKQDGWQAISRDDALASLDALKELVLAPSLEESSL